MTTTHPRLRSTALASALLVVMILLSAFASTAAAATALQVNIREANLEPSGKVQLVVSASGAAVDSTLSAEDFTVTEDGNYLIITVFQGTDVKNRVYYKDLKAKDAPVVKLLDDFDAAYGFVGNEGSRFWFQTDLQAPRGKLIEIDTANPARSRRPR